MKKLLLLFALIALNTVDAQTYYNVDDSKISKSTFQKLLLETNLYSVENDSLKNYKLMDRNQRSESGSLGDTENLFKELNEKLHLKLDSSKPLIIYYYPGKDPCNSGGMYSIRREYLKSDKQLAKKVKAIADVNILRIYKNKEGLTTIKDHDWKKDPNKLIENLFFNYHYGCESFVIINKSNYLTFFGEYGHKQVTESLKEILEK